MDKLLTHAGLGLALLLMAACEAPQPEVDAAAPAPAVDEAPVDPPAAVRKFYQPGTAKLRAPSKAEMDQLKDEVIEKSRRENDPMAVIEVQMPDGRMMIVPGPGYQTPSYAVIGDDGKLRISHDRPHAEGAQ